MRKIIGMMMVVMLMMGCNSRVAELEKRNEFLESIANLGKGFLDVFVTFGDMVAGAFGIKADTKKSDVGKYFTDIATTMEKVKKKLNDEVSQNRNYAKVKTVVEQFITGTLEKIASRAREAAKGATSDAVIGNDKQNEDANPADKDAVNSLVKGIKEIVGVVLKDNEGDAGATKTAENEKKSIGKLFGEKTNDGTEAQAAAASASIGAVSGSDILRAIASSGEAANNDVQIANAKNAAEIAAAKKEVKDLEVDTAKKDAVIAGGIALRGMAKDGKLAAKNDEEKSAHAVNGAVANAVGKVLSTLIVAIRDTVDNGLNKIKEELGKVKEEDRVEEVGNTKSETVSVKR